MFLKSPVDKDLDEAWETGVGDKDTGCSFGKHVFDPVVDLIKCHNPEFTCNFKYFPMKLR